jgi:hypothetical protein
MTGPSEPVDPIGAVLARLEAIDTELPAADGVACFNRMYLEVTRAVGQQVQQGFFCDPDFVAQLDAVFAGMYFQAADAMAGPLSSVPVAWRPLVAARGMSGIEPVQYALAGMNAHINHDLPQAVLATCTELNTAPTDGTHHDDYQKIDKLLDAAEQSVRESFEPSDLRVADRHFAAVTNLICNWSMNEARDVAWDSALALWAVRDHGLAMRLISNSLARVTALGSATLLVAV